MLRSSLCTQAQLESEAFRTWWSKMRGTPLMHRKVWEFCFIAQALHERGMLAPGRRGLGFAVGQEPLAALFASMGCEIVATDLDPDTAHRAGWVETGQHAASLEALNAQGLCEPEAFRRRVSFRVVDMNAIPPDLTGFDFAWSSCAFEHLGSIDRGLRFIERMTRCIKPGGVGVHTTEFNLSSNTDTIDSGGTVLFRECDLERLKDRLAVRGHRLELDLDRGNGDADLIVDRPPYRNDPHLKLLVQGYIVTSMGVVVEVGSPPHPSLDRKMDLARDAWDRLAGA